MNNSATDSTSNLPLLYAELSRFLMEQDLRMVFPSEVSAGWWRRAAAVHSGGAVRSERFISWDRFKEATFERRRRERPSNNILRMLFANDLLERNRRDQQGALFERFISPEYRESSPAFASAIVSLLPTLELLLERLDRVDATTSPPEAAGRRALFTDLRLLHAEYRAFLERHGLFEPAYLKAEERMPEGRHLLVCPEALEDFAEFADPVARMSSVEVYPVPGSLGPCTLWRFENSVQEIQAAVSQLEELLDAGVPQSDIAITVCEDERYLTELFSRAALREVPLQARYGGPLTELAGGRLMLRIEELGAASFAVSELGSLLLDQALPVRDRELAKRVVELGVRHGCIGGDPPGGPGAWERAFSNGDVGRGAAGANTAGANTAGGNTAGGARQEARYFRTLRSAVSEVRRAESFSALRTALNKFLNAFLDTDSWDEEGKRTLQWAQDLVAELRDIERELSLVVGNPWRVFLRLLQTRRYVPLRRPAAIPVYLYRVGAGIAPRYHFVLGASQQATRVSVDPFGYLSADLKDDLELPEHDITEDVLRLFSHSGSELRMSFAVESFGGRRLTPPLFLREGRVREPTAEMRTGWAELDCYRTELQAVVDGRAAARLYRRQHAGLSAAAVSGCGEGGCELDEGPISDDGLRRRVHERLRRDDELRLSSTHLQSYAACPFEFLIRHGVGVRRVEYQAAPEAPVEIGTLYHTALERLCREIKAADACIRVEHRPRYQELLSNVIATVVERDLPRDTGIASAFVPALRMRMARQLALFLDGLLDRFRDHAILETEAWRVAPVQAAFVETDAEEERGAEAVGFIGKLDLILQRPADGATIVLDYKLGATPKKRDLLALLDEQPQTVPAFQMAVYAELLEHTQPPFGAALYYSIKDNRFSAALGDDHAGAWVKRNQLAAISGAVCAHAREIADRIAAGRYEENLLQDSCAGCEARAICRRKFYIR